MLYLVKVNVTITQYMCDDSKKIDQIHIVNADSVEEASEKAIAHYDAMTSEYSVYFSADVEYVNEAIM